MRRKKKKPKTVKPPSRRAIIIRFDRLMQVKFVIIAVIDVAKFIEIPRSARHHYTVYCRNGIIILQQVRVLYKRGVDVHNVYNDATFEYNIIDCLFFPADRLHGRGARRFFRQTSGPGEARVLRLYCIIYAYT